MKELSLNKQVKNKIVDLLGTLSESRNRFLYDDITKLIEEKEAYGFKFANLAHIHYQIYNKELDVSEELIEVCAALESMIIGFDIIDDIQDKELDKYNLKSNPINNALVALTIFQFTIHKNSSINFDIKLLYKYLLKSIEGQDVDLYSNIHTEQDVLDMIKLKSGSLTTFSCMLGAFMAKNKNNIGIQEYGNLIGMIAQIHNDVSDLKNWRYKSDLKLKRVTLPILYLLKDSKNNLIQRYYLNLVSFENLIQDSDEIDHLILKSGCIQYAMIFAEIYRIEYINKINSLDIEDFYKKQLINIIEENTNAKDCSIFN